MDTLRADHVGAYGYPRPTTPRIDRLAAESVLFADAVSQSAWTRPAHSSMFTGLYPAEHGVLDMASRAKLDPALATLAGTLRASGYATAAFTGGANMSAHFGFGTGFDVYRSPGRRIADSLPEVEAWLDRAEEPFFLFVHGFDPHRPFRSERVDRAALGLPAERARGLQRACRLEVREAEMAPYIAEYDAAVHHGDRGVGALLDVLARRGLDDRTVVVFTSDHGEEFLEHGRCFHIRTLYREVGRVPLLFRIPGVPARVVHGVVPASVAVPATVLDAVGVREHAMPGPSLLAQVLGAPADFDYVVSETSSRYVDGRGYGHVQALTANDEKLVHWIEQSRYEYFDLHADPQELRPVTAGARVARAAAELDRWRGEHPRVAAEITAGPAPPSLVRQLRALGYAE